MPCLLHCFTAAFVQQELQHHVHPQVGGPTQNPDSIVSIVVDFLNARLRCRHHLGLSVATSAVNQGLLDVAGGKYYLVVGWGSRIQHSMEDAGDGGSGHEPGKTTQHTRNSNEPGRAGGRAGQRQ